MLGEYRLLCFLNESGSRHPIITHIYSPNSLLNSFNVEWQYIEYIQIFYLIYFGCYSVIKLEACQQFIGLFTSDFARAGTMSRQWNHDFKQSLWLVSKWSAWPIMQKLFPAPWTVFSLPGSVSLDFDKYFRKNQIPAYFPVFIKTDQIHTFFQVALQFK